jgi:hypothetical protein
MKKAIVCFVLIEIFLCPPVHAGGAAAMKQQRGMMQQKQMMQQMMIQKQIQMRQQLQQKAIMERALAEKQKAMIEQRTRVHHQINVHQGGEMIVPLNISAEQAGVEEVAEFDEVISSLNQTSQAWPLMIDFEAKEAVVNYYISQYRQEGGHIQKPARHYVELLDSMTSVEPKMLEQPFSNVLRIVAILEYDFDNGQNKDAMAERVLGNPEAVEKNRLRLGIQ